MLAHRVLSALVGIPLVLWAVWQGGLFLLLLLGLLMLLAAGEFVALSRGWGATLSLFLIWPALVVLLLAVYYGGKQLLLLVYILLPLFLLAVFVFVYPRFQPADIALHLLAVYYCGLPVFAWLIRQLPGGLYWLLLLFLAVWVVDTAAYFAGRSLGRRKMAPNLSPGKTWTGFIGGLAGSAALAMVFGHYVNSLPAVGVWSVALLTGLLAPLGDLVESGLKRTAGQKDAGGLIPGHGGVLDRFDSLLYTAPLVYLLVAHSIIT
ncbi:MAG: phosphatidate cytidylyltransferase [Bacillota bacterium]|uniref:phosphatidate cytidylyltransferase n=1 Tax=Desulfurispora thermophila TaxID=265470 RepID=UPI00037EF518|nr:phosphatidate cytidylyltransferase [Desulfurispora thermophila]